MNLKDRFIAALDKKHIC